MEVYDRAVRTVIDKERFEVYTLYLARATQFFGVGKVFQYCCLLGFHATGVGSLYQYSCVLAISERISKINCFFALS